MQVQSLDWEEPLKEGMATHCIILAWEIPWTEDLDRLQSTVLQRFEHKQLHTHALDTHILINNYSYLLLTFSYVEDIQMQIST